MYVNKHCHCFRSGTIYKKAVYREYEDATFKKAKPHPPELGKLILKIFSYGIIMLPLEACQKQWLTTQWAIARV